MDVSATQITNLTSRLFLIDRSNSGIVDVQGQDALDLLQRITTNDLRGMKSGDVRPTIFVTEKGRILDYVHVLATLNAIILITSPGREIDVKSWIDKYTIMEDVRTSVRLEYQVMYSLIGENAVQTARQLGINVDVMKHGLVQPAGLAYVIAEFGTEFVNILIGQDAAEGLWNKLASSSANVGIPIIDSNQFDAWRVTSGIPSSPGEFNDSFNPYEADLRHAISYTKGCYIGQEIIARLDTYQKVQRHKVGIVADSVLPVSVLPLDLWVKGDVVGWLTSAVAANGRTIGIGIVKKEFEPGDMLEARQANQNVPVTITAFPIPVS
ncbi:MAG: YgfZ/GcvT domain-containing protein [Bacteroidota bacterium]